MKILFHSTFYIFWLFLCSYQYNHAQTIQISPTNGVQDIRPNYAAYTNATIWIDYQTKIEKATLIVRNGVVEAVGANLPAPKGAVAIDMQGKWIYPSFIDLYSDYGMPELKKGGGGGFFSEQFTSEKKGAFYWNQSIQPETQAESIFTTNYTAAQDLRKAGFGAVLTHYQDGLIRGTGALVTLRKGLENEVMLKGRASSHFSFYKGTSKQSFPASDMGGVALIRQTYIDADWYAKTTENKEHNLSLEAFQRNKDLPAIFESKNRLYSLRIEAIGKEFNANYIVKGTGDEYQRLQEIKAMGYPFILPLNFPDAYNVTDVLEASLVSFTQMKHWELAPTNAAQLAKAGVMITFTMHGLKNKTDFLTNLRKAVQYGLPEADALKALTYNPAKLLKSEKTLGLLQQGAVANFLVTSGNIFQTETTLYDNYIQGYAYPLQPTVTADVRGLYDLTMSVPQASYQFSLKGKMESPTPLIERATDTLKVSPKMTLQGNTISLSFNATKKTETGETRLTGWASGKNWQGTGETPQGQRITWQATYKSAVPTDSIKPITPPAVIEVGKVIYPFEVYGSETLPTAQTYLIKNTTVWTNEQEGVLKETDVLVSNGKITKVGKNLSEIGAKLIDGKGKHLTAGIIDEHSHIALYSINDVQTVSAEVRMADVVNSEDVDIYRQLAGGVTTSQLLHGSANCIGGQSAIIKLKWGESPNKLLFPNASKFIKFALGENPKNGNSGFGNTQRYPQTRMGVEQAIEDAFVRAKEYLEKKQKGGISFRRDLELETVGEILEGKRYITCHSYVQSEINMLIKLADKHKFKVNTFTHILEGYKVGDKMKAHGAGASSFSDWWAYKYEVQDAIPYNAAILTRLGVTTAINSDDPEMARRLNQEAAKTIKYGGLSEEEAWKTVTLNPAKLLHIDDKVGSVKVGKDADLVLWSANPLSIYATVETNMIDGTIYFDRAQDEQAQTKLREERARLIQKMLQAKQQGAPTQKPAFQKLRKWSCCADVGSLLSE